MSCNKNPYKLNNCFLIGPTGPTGATGPTGPTGPSGQSTVAAFGSKYDTTETPITLTQNVQSTLTLNTNGLLSNITSTSSNTLTIVDDGTYKIDYQFQGSSSAAGTLTLEVTKNATSISNSTISKNITANTDESLTGSIIVELQSGDEIGLALESSVAATVTPTSGTSTYLNIIKIS